MARHDDDPNRVAARLVRQVTGQDTTLPEDGQAHERAVETGRDGGLKGGRARAEKLSPEERSESARTAAQARWDRESA